jgi:hypothetical protein
MRKEAPRKKKLTRNEEKKIDKHGYMGKTKEHGHNYDGHHKRILLLIREVI